MQRTRRWIETTKDNLINKLHQTNAREVAAYGAFFLGLALAVVISIPLFLGAFSIVWGDKEIPSAMASLQLAFVSAALGAVVLWYVTQLNKRFTGKTARETNISKRLMSFQRRGALLIGTALLFSAMCFTLFALLAPIFPSVKDAQDVWSEVIKYTAVLSLMAGGIALGFSLCIGIFEIWVWSLTND